MCSEILNIFYNIRTDTSWKEKKTSTTVTKKKTVLNIPIWLTFIEYNTRHYEITIFPIRCTANLIIYHSKYFFNDLFI